MFQIIYHIPLLKLLFFLGVQMMGNNRDTYTDRQEQIYTIQG